MIADVVRTLCSTLNGRSSSHSDALFAATRGRDDFGPRLCKWLQDSRSFFPEPVQVEHVDHPSDHGVDVFVKGLRSQEVVAFQLKSNHDFQGKDFQREIKAQITDARAWGNIQLYVIVLGCDTKQEFRYRFLVNDSLRYWTEVLVLPPGRAAALWERCEHPLTGDDRTALQQEKTWSSFFFNLGKQSREAEFIDLWPNLTPDQRFVEPEEFESIRESVTRKPLTVITGPPTVGKTFTAVQLLWEHYSEGRPVCWIEPQVAGLPHSMYPGPGRTPNLPELTTNLCKQLGVKPPSPPQHVYEFITTTLRPDTLVLIEDPFGARDADFEFALHTYDFFDLHACVRAISSGKTPNCHLLLTSRQGLFERWLAELSAKRRKAPRMSLICLSPESYRHLDTETVDPKLEMTSLLLNSARRDYSGTTEEQAARIINRSTSTPWEVGKIVRGLSSPVSINDLEHQLLLHRNEISADIGHHCHPSDDAERLFLLLLLALSNHGWGIGGEDFHARFATAHRWYGLGGSPAELIEQMRVKFWPLFYVASAPRGKEHFEPIHWSVGEAIERELASDQGLFLSTATQLLLAPETSSTDKDRDRFLQINVAAVMCKHTPRLSEQATSNLADFIEHCGVTSQPVFRHAILSNWSSFPEVIKTKFLKAVEASERNYAADVCSDMQSYAESLGPDRWRFYEIAGHGDLAGVNRMSLAHPWRYFLEHLGEAPSTLSGVFEIATQVQPDWLQIVLGGLLASHWDYFPGHWREAMLSDVASGCVTGLDHICLGLMGAREGDIRPEIQSYLERQLSHSSWRIRTVAAGNAILQKGRLSPRLFEIVTNLIREDPNPLVPLGIISDTSSLKDEGAKLAHIAAERNGEAYLGALLQVMLDAREKKGSWFDGIGMDLYRRPGEFGRAAILSLPDSARRAELQGKTGLQVSPAWESEPEVVKLAHVWTTAMHLEPGASGQSESRGILDLVVSLTGKCAELAHFVLAHQYWFLPEELQSYLKRELQSEGTAVSEAIKSGAECGRSHHSPNTRYYQALPISALIPDVDLPLRTPFPCAPRPVGQFFLPPEAAEIMQLSKGRRLRRRQRLENKRKPESDSDEE